jgi:hypothetical protein
MRKFLIALASLVGLVAGALAIWIFGGRELVLIIDRYWTAETVAARINSVAYEGPGSGGILMVNDLQLSLSERTAGISPSIGSTKDGQFALATGGKVFPFGPSQSISEDGGGEKLATVPPAGDEAFLTIRRSALSWPTSFDFNFMTGQSPSWKRHVYYRVHWRKQSGATLKMLWRYEQYFDPANGWGSGFMTREGSTGLIEVDIHP